MKTTSIYRTQINASTVVSTVLVQDGGARFYETSFIVDGNVSDGVRASKKFDAGNNHDRTVAFFLYPSARDVKGSLFAARLDSQLKTIGG